MAKNEGEPWTAHTKNAPPPRACVGACAGTLDPILLISDCRECATTGRGSCHRPNHGRRISLFSLLRLVLLCLVLATAPWLRAFRFHLQIYHGTCASQIGILHDSNSARLFALTELRWRKKEGRTSISSGLATAPPRWPGHLCRRTVARRPHGVESLAKHPSSQSVH